MSDLIIRGGNIMNYKISFYKDKEFFQGREREVGYTLIHILELIEYIKKTDMPFKDYINAINIHINHESSINLESNILSLHDLKFNITENEFNILKKLLILISEYIDNYSKKVEYYNLDIFHYIIKTILQIDFPNCEIIYDTQVVDELNRKYKCFGKDSLIYNNSYILKSLPMLLDNTINGNKKYIYATESINDILLASMIVLIKSKLLIKKCEQGSKYFIAYNRSDIMYCNNIYFDINNERCKDDLSETCRQYNKRIGAYVKTFGDSKMAEKRKIRQRIRARIVRGVETLKYLEEWESKVEEKEKILKGTAAYLKWLKQSDEHSRSNKGGISDGNKKNR